MNALSRVKITNAKEDKSRSRPSSNSKSANIADNADEQHQLSSIKCKDAINGITMKCQCYILVYIGYSVLICGRHINILAIFTLTHQIQIIVTHDQSKKVTSQSTSLS